MSLIRKAAAKKTNRLHHEGTKITKFKIIISEAFVSFVSFVVRMYFARMAQATNRRKKVYASRAKFRA